jgi:AraC family transcriptional regulator, regulatory protein of adaptative response / methylated-DNA-[protein]-cysteine methyltransferase
MRSTHTSAMISGPFATDEARWQAVMRRDPAADRAFVYSVRSTGVYCRPGCASRLPLRRNVRFHATAAAAEAAGFRACRRCQPDAPQPNRAATVIAAACRLIERADKVPSLADLARAVGLSGSHFHRLFKAQTGVTPKQYAAAHCAQRVQTELSRTSTVTDAVYSAGFGSSGRFYESSAKRLGMTPTMFRAGGPGLSIRFAVGECWLGAVLVAATDRGVCAILLGDDPHQIACDLHDRFPKADLIGGDAAFEHWVAVVVGFVANPAIGLDLPLDIQGTAFQQRVWRALRDIPPGSTMSYSDVAIQLGLPKSARAIATACAANPLAVAIPCHRVVRTDGSLSGYRWGVERKQALHARERE